LPILQKGRTTVEWTWWCHGNATKSIIFIWYVQ